MGANANTFGVGRDRKGAAATASPSHALKGEPRLTVNWTAEEQAILEELLNKYASELPVIRYAKIATQLHGKFVRDVALRCRWMAKKESGKRRKDDTLSRKNTDKKERAIGSSVKPSSQLAARPNAPPYSKPMLQGENDDDISYKAIGGPTGELLEHTAQIFNQISGNFTNFQINDNLGLLFQARENIYKVMNELNDIHGVMKLMPPLPFKLNDELANTILPITTLPISPLPPQT